MTRRRRRLLIAAPFVGFLVWALASYAIWMLAPSSENFDARSVEWVRQEFPFGNSIVDEGEHIYYSINAPSKGGPQLKALPRVGLAELPSGPTGPPAPAGSTTPRSRHPRKEPAPGTLTGPAGPTGPTGPAQVKRQDMQLPAPIKPIFRRPLPGEGVWKPTGPPVDGGPPVLVTTFRPEREYPQIVAYVAWFDHTRSEIGYYPGRYEPPNATARGPMMVPYDQRSRLLATFNGGFTYEDGENGSAVNGHTNEPLKDGLATLIGYRDGDVGIVKWSGGPNPGPDVAWARQSLAPILWNRQLNPELNEEPNSPQWGFTLGGVTRVWRTAVGIDPHGNLIYVAAEDQTVISIAKILKDAGAVRGMEFDINPYWHTLITYSHRHGLDPTMVAPNPEQPDTRYLVPDDRDFFAVYRPVPGPVTVPFK